MKNCNWKDYEMRRNAANCVENAYKTRARSPRLLELVLVAAVSFGIFSLFCIALSSSTAGYSPVSPEIANSDSIVENQKPIQESDSDRVNLTFTAESILMDQPAPAPVVDDGAGK